MDISPETISKYKIKKVLKISIFILLFFVIGLLIFEYFRITPSNVRFTNVTSSSVTVSWSSKSPVSATVIPFEGNTTFPIRLFCFFKEKFFDSRDVTKAELKAVEETSKNLSESDSMSVDMSQIETEVKFDEKGKYYTHHIVVGDLNPETEYSFMIGDSLVYRKVKNLTGELTEKTFTTAESIKTPNPAYGSIKNADNRTDISINELLTVKDGIVYLNLYDEISGKRSRVFSSSINEEGNWYMDLSLVEDYEGNPFVETYGNPEEEIIVEITLDAGPLGIWKKLADSDVLTPASLIVINDPYGVSDYNVDGAIEKFYEFPVEDVKGVTMAVLIDDISKVECKKSGGTWNESSSPKCKCPSDKTLNTATGKCESATSPTDPNCGECVVNNPCPPKNYDDYTSTTANGTSYKTSIKDGEDSCGNKCTKHTRCYKPMSEIIDDPNTPCDFPVYCPESGKCTPKLPNGSYDINNYCSCPNEILMARMCDSAEWGTESEKKVSCAAGYTAGETACYNGQCLVCAEYVVNHERRGRFVGTDNIVHCIKDSDCTSIEIEGGPKCGTAHEKTVPYENTSLNGSELCQMGTPSISSINLNDTFSASWKCLKEINGINFSTTCNTTRSQSPTMEPRCVDYESFPPIEKIPDNPKVLCEDGIPSSLEISQPAKNSVTWKCILGQAEVTCNATLIPEGPLIGNCNIGDMKEKNGVIQVCTIENTYKNLDTICDWDEYTNNNSIWQWNDQGYCAFDKCREGYMEATIPHTCISIARTDELACFSSNKKLYVIRDGMVYFCKNNQLEKDTPTDRQYQGSYCKDLTDTNNYCYPNGEYCFKNNTLYFCKKRKWENASSINKGNEIIADNIVNISAGKECTGKEAEEGNSACKCNYNKQVITIGEWCIQSDCISNEEIGDVCSNKGNKCVLQDHGMGSRSLGCSGSPDQSNVPEIYSSLEDSGGQCLYPKCICRGGPDDGLMINSTEYCPQVHSCHTGGKIGKICDTSGSVCNESGNCEGDPEEIYHNGSKTISLYEKCVYIDSDHYSNERVCICPETGSIDTEVGINQYCREVSKCTSNSDDEKVCSKEGFTCITLGGQSKCIGEKIDSINSLDNINIKKNLLSQLSSKVFGQENLSTDFYVINQELGMFENIQEGSYSFEHNGQLYYFTVGDTQPYQKIYIDGNNNGKYDSETDTLVSELASKVEIQPVELKYTYVLEQGFNFVTFPFLVSNSDFRTAASLLKKLNEIYGDSIYSISKFDSSWKIVGQNDEIYSNNDFQLLPGQGYVIKSKNNISISILGKPVKYEKVTDSAPVSLFLGWNLIGVYGTKARVYTAKTLLQDINSFEGVDFTADIVNGWDQEAQSYEGFVLENTNGIESEYGFDFPINTLKSYFVRVQDGKGNWQPSLAE